MKIYDEENRATRQKLEQYQAEVQQRLKQEEELRRQLEQRLNREREEKLKQAEEAERLRRENEEILKKQKESEEQVQVLTGGIGYDMFKKINLQKAQAAEEQAEKECAICMENQVEIELVPCKFRFTISFTFVQVGTRLSVEIVLKRCPREYAPCVVKP